MSGFKTCRGASRRVEDFQRLQSALAGRYVIERELARGGMSTVYLATELHPRRTVAIKVFDPAISARVGDERFRREIDLVSALTHPGIVAVYAAGEVDGLLYYVMPFVEGETLRERLDRESQLDVEDALMIARDLAEALDYAHRRNVVHRDIKPQNVLLHEGRAFLADFGVAKAVYDRAGSVLTDEGQAVGTPEYMSPEQILGRPTLDARSDVYALACVVYEMLVGEAPFHGRTSQSILTRQLSDMPSLMRNHRPTLPAALDDVVGRALAKSPTDRFATILEFAAALIHAVDPSANVRFATPTPRTPLPFMTGQFRKSRRRWVVSSLGIVAVVSGLGILGRWLFAPPASAAADSMLRVAVRAVDNHTGTADNDAIAEFITADLITTLHRATGLEVKDRSSSVALQRALLTTRQFAESLEVAYVIESELRNSADSLELHATLTDSTGSVLRSARAAAPGRASDVRLRSAMVHAVAQDLVGAFPRQVALAPYGQHGHTSGRDHLLNGTKELARRSRGGLRLAVTYFDSAVLADRDYAEAWAELSKAYALALTYRYRMDVEPYEAAGLALVAAERAIQLEPDLSAAFAARGYAARQTLAPREVVVASFDTAKALDPNAADAVGWSSLTLSLQGLTNEAIAQAERAILLDKYSASRRITLAVVSVTSRRFDAAAQSAAEARTRAPELALATAWWARSLVLGGRGGECADMAPGPHAGLRALCLRAAGRDDEARAVMDSLRALIEAGLRDSTFTDAIRYEDAATYYAYAGDAAEAGRWVERAYEVAPNGVAPDLLESALFEPVRSSPAFTSVLQRAQSRAMQRVRAARAAVLERFQPVASSRVG